MVRSGRDLSKLARRVIGGIGGSGRRNLHQSLNSPRNRPMGRRLCAYHQAKLSAKNALHRTQGNFIPTIKILKHLRSLSKLSTVSFHIECLLYSLEDWLFVAGTSRCLASPSSCLNCSSFFTLLLHEFHQMDDGEKLALRKNMPTDLREIFFAVKRVGLHYTLF